MPRRDKHGDVEQAARLRGRLAQWQTYVGDTDAAKDPAANANHGFVAQLNTEGNSETVIVAARSASRNGDARATPGRLYEPTDGQGGGNGMSGAAEESVVVPASYLADLRAAVDTERDHARHLAGTVARAQTLHAMTLQRRAAPNSEEALDGGTVGVHVHEMEFSYANREPHRRRIYTHETSSGSRPLRLAAQIACALLFSAVGFGLVLFFLLGH